MSVSDIKQSFLDNLCCGLGRIPLVATPNDAYTALALTVRDRVLKRGVETLETYTRRDVRVVAYLSAEFMPGPHLGNNLLNLGILEPTRVALAELGLNLPNLIDQEAEPGLGNGGLGRLASCYLDSLATLEVPAVGYGIRYEFGIFDPQFQEQWREVKLTVKRDLATLIAQRTGIKVNPASLFDIQAKRLHEYKRQHLNVLHILTLYLRLKRDPQANQPARTFIFAAKAAPGYVMAKLIIKLINAVAAVVNHDAEVSGRLKVVFFPNFNVKNAQRIYPAADLSEQISTSGKEASGTGNMKFALNGALTIGTLDGANVEIREEVGTDNFFLFGLDVAHAMQLKSRGYQPRDIYQNNTALREVLDFIASGTLAGSDTTLFRPLVNNLLDSDPFLVLADYQAYVDCQQQVSALWLDPQAWTRMAILNVARMGKFSSDRSIREYCQRIWKVNPVAVI